MAAIVEEVTRSGARITAALDALTDLEMRAPSTLAGWTRGHVITHMALSVGAYQRLLAVARTGMESAPRTEAKALARAVRNGADRPAADLAAWYTLYRCWRALETHHVDLNVGYRTTDWPRSRGRSGTSTKARPFEIGSHRQSSAVIGSLELPGIHARQRVPASCTATGQLPGSTVRAGARFEGGHLAERSETLDPRGVIEAARIGVTDRRGTTARGTAAGRERAGLL